VPDVADQGGFTPPRADEAFPEGTLFFDVFLEDVPGAAVPVGDGSGVAVVYEDSLDPEPISVAVLGGRSLRIDESEFRALVARRFGSRIG